MKRLTKVTLKTLAVLAIVASSIAVGPGWGVAIGTLVIIVIVVVGGVVDHFVEKKGWLPFGGPRPRRRRDDEVATPQQTEGADNEEIEEGTKPQHSDNREVPPPDR
jgi:hypothetical protein